jgi:hypothetical protein
MIKQDHAQVYPFPPMDEIVAVVVTWELGPFSSLSYPVFLPLHFFWKWPFTELALILVQENMSLFLYI